MADHGGRRPGAGRPKGAKDTATREAGATMAELARGHGERALEVLWQIASEGESESARVAACNALLDRGFGKPSQTIDNTSSDGSMSPHGKSLDDFYRDAPPAGE